MARLPPPQEFITAIKKLDPDYIANRFYCPAEALTKLVERLEEDNVAGRFHPTVTTSLVNASLPIKKLSQCTHCGDTWRGNHTDQTDTTVRERIWWLTSWEGASLTEILRAAAVQAAVRTVKTTTLHPSTPKTTRSATRTNAPLATTPSATSLTPSRAYLTRSCLG